MQDDRVCRNCFRRIAPGVVAYTVRVDVFPNVEDSLRVASERIAGGENPEDELARLVAAMDAMDEAAVRREEELVHSRFQFVVCPECRDALAEGMETGRVDLRA